VRALCSDLAAERSSWTEVPFFHFGPESDVATTAAAHAVTRGKITLISVNLPGSVKGETAVVRFRSKQPFADVAAFLYLFSVTIIGRRTPIGQCTRPRSTTF
jgi:hypothetical protein